MQMIALDIETTGLNPREDKITEIAAIRFDGEKILDSYQTLVNPERPIPSNITQLTHITNDMVRGAPKILEVLDPLAKFVGSDPIIGHNIGFDLSFLYQGNILKKNPVFDTYELAAVLMPSATRYNLSALGQQLGIQNEEAHRALSDCQTTIHVFNKLIEQIYDLPLTLLIHLAHSGDRIGWNEAKLFTAVANDRVKKGETASRTYTIPFPTTDFANIENIPPLEPETYTTPLDLDKAAAYLENDGAFSQELTYYEERPQQIQMLRAVGNAFSRGRHMLIEAGTGTGKSFAYLIPSALWATQNGERVVISTNTINLQDQLIRKDIPQLQQIFETEVRATVLKGRSNYLCSRNLQRLFSHGPDTTEEFRILGKILVWLSQGGNGDRTTLTLNRPIERDIWRSVSAENDSCRPKACPFFHDHRCPYYAAHAKAQRAHIIVVNHSLLLSDLAMDGRVLPPYNYLIVDEGHHLENAATNAFSTRLTKFDLNRIVQEIGTASSGLMGRILTSLTEQVSPETYADYKAKADAISEKIPGIEVTITTIFNEFADFMREQRNNADLTVYGQTERLTGATRTSPQWANVEIVWDNAGAVLNDWLDEINEFYEDLSHESALPDELIEQSDLLEGVIRNATDYIRLFEELIMKPKSDYIYWVEIAAVNNYLALNAAPLQVGSLIESNIWHTKESAIITSATLTTDNSFNYIRERLNAQEADEVTVGSPFDYQKAVLLYLPTDIPEPNQGAAQSMVENTVSKLAQATKGRMLVLFTSYAQLKRTSNALNASLRNAGITIFEQGEGASATALLETFRETEKAILLGTRSFWEGVDIQGEQLSCVVIVKLPFDVPTDPIVAARSESFENPFSQYSIPEAILKFRQGFGRLIRSSTDRGIVVILDSRITTKRYGREFLNSIPRCTEKRGSIRELPREAAHWLNK